MKIDYVLLGLIRMRPSLSGYEMKDIITRSTGFFFTAHLSQIYPSLKKMADAGWVTFSLQPQEGKPDRKLYTITRAGSKALDAWLLQPFAFKWTRASLDEYFMKLIFMGHLDPADVVGYLDQGIAYISENLAATRAGNLETEFGFIGDLPEPAHTRYEAIWSEEFGFTIRELQARLDWLQDVRAKMQTLE